MPRYEAFVRETIYRKLDLAVEADSPEEAARLMEDWQENDCVEVLHRTDGLEGQDMNTPRVKP